MPNSRKIWGWFVLCVGLLWLFAGIAAILQTQLPGWIYLFCGAALSRLGYNLTRNGDPPP